MTCDPGVPPVAAVSVVRNDVSRVWNESPADPGSVKDAADTWLLLLTEGRCGSGGGGGG
jgi:hypothetical protein